MLSPEAEERAQHAGTERRPTRLALPILFIVLSAGVFVLSTFSSLRDNLPISVSGLMFKAGVRTAAGTSSSMGSARATESSRAGVKTGMLSSKNIARARGSSKAATDEVSEDVEGESRGAAREEAVSEDDKWMADVQRVNPASAWERIIWEGRDTHAWVPPTRPDPCPRKLIAYKDWEGAQTNNVIMALVNALYLAHVNNRTLVLSDNAEKIMTTLFDPAGMKSHFCVLSQTEVKAGRPGKVVGGKGLHGG